MLKLNKHLQGCRLADLEQTADDQRQVPGIILGSELAKQLRVYKNDRIRLMSTAGPLTPIGIIPRIRTCRVIGTFKTDMYEYDASLAYISLSTAQEFLELGNTVHGIEIKVKDIYQAAEIGRQIEERFGLGYLAKDWMKMNKNRY